MQRRCAAGALLGLLTVAACSIDPLFLDMSGDFEDAVCAGADVLRIGSALYAGLELPHREAS